MLLLCHDLRGQNRQCQMPTSLVETPCEKIHAQVHGVGVGRRCAINPSANQSSNLCICNWQLRSSYVYINMYTHCIFVHTYQDIAINFSVRITPEQYPTLLVNVQIILRGCKTCECHGCQCFSARAQNSPMPKLARADPDRLLNFSGGQPRFRTPGCKMTYGLLVLLWAK